MGPNLYWWLGFEQAWFIVFYVCDTSGLLSSQPDATQVPQWLNPNSDGWPHDHLMTLPRAPAGTSGFGILSNAVIYTPLRQVRAFRLPFGMVCFCSWAPPPPTPHCGWRKYFGEELWTSKSFAHVQQSWKYIQYLTALVWILSTVHPWI